MSLNQFVLFLHIAIAIIGFGPTFAFPFLDAAGGKEPAHNNFALRVGELIRKRVVIPLAVAMPLVGLWLIYLNNWDLWASEWLWISIVIYVALFFSAVFIMDPTIGRLIELSRQTPPSGDAPAEPPPEVQKLVKRVQLFGTLLGLAIVSIVLLMVWKPGAALVTP